MYGLPQSGKIEKYKLRLYLVKFGYEPSPTTSGLWRHQTNPLQFSLVVDDFRVKHGRQAGITHLLDAPKNVQNILGLGCKSMLWTKLRVGLPQTGSAGLNE